MYMNGTCHPQACFFVNRFRLFPQQAPRIIHHAKELSCFTYVLPAKSIEESGITRLTTSFKKTAFIKIHTPGMLDKYQNIFSWYFFILKICPNNHFFARWCHQPVAVVVTTTIATFGWARVCDVRPALRPPLHVAFSSVLFHLSYQPHLANKRVIALP